MTVTEKRINGGEDLSVCWKAVPETSETASSLSRILMECVLLYHEKVR